MLGLAQANLEQDIHVEKEKINNESSDMNQQANTLENENDTCINQEEPSQTIEDKWLTRKEMRSRRLNEKYRPNKKQRK